MHFHGCSYIITPRVYALAGLKSLVYTPFSAVRSLRTQAFAYKIAKIMCNNDSWLARGMCAPHTSSSRIGYRIVAYIEIFSGLIFTYFAS